MAKKMTALQKSWQKYRKLEERDAAVSLDALNLNLARRCFYAGACAAYDELFRGHFGRPRLRDRDGASAMRAELVERRDYLAKTGPRNLQVRFRK